MLASAIGIDARVEPDVRAIVAGDDRTRGVSQEDGSVPRLLVGLRGLRLDLDPLEAIPGIARRPATDDASPILLRLLHRLILNATNPPHYTFLDQAVVWAESRVLRAAHPRRASFDRRHDTRPRRLDGRQACPHRR